MWKRRKEDVTEDWSPGDCFPEARTTSFCLSSALYSAYNTVGPPRLERIRNRKPGKKSWFGKADTEFYIKEVVLEMLREIHVWGQRAWD